MITLSDIVRTMQQKGYVVYTEPYRLNVVGIRTGSTTSVKFDDYIAYFWYDEKGVLQGKVCLATTDPSVYFLNNPMVSGGTAILKSGQYVNAYEIGTHRGKYKALVQRGPVTVIRDNDRNDLLNFFAETQTGSDFGINIHRASLTKQDKLVIDEDSAGCQVFQDPNDFANMMRAAEVSKAKYGNKFTYTLIDEQDTVKFKRNLALVGVGFILVGLGGYLYYKKFR